MGSCVSVPKTSLRLSESLEGLIGLGKAVVPTVTVYYTERGQIVTRKGNRYMR